MAVMSSNLNYAGSTDLTYVENDSTDGGTSLSGRGESHSLLLHERIPEIMCNKPVTSNDQIL